jgi:hypothetical protein
MHRRWLTGLVANDVHRLFDEWLARILGTPAREQREQRRGTCAGHHISSAQQCEVSGDARSFGSGALYRRETEHEAAAFGERHTGSERIVANVAAQLESRMRFLWIRRHDAFADVPIRRAAGHEIEALVETYLA